MLFVEYLENFGLKPFVLVFKDLFQDSIIF